MTGSKAEPIKVLVTGDDLGGNQALIDTLQKSIEDSEIIPVQNYYPSPPESNEKSITKYLNGLFKNANFGGFRRKSKVVISKETLEKREKKRRAKRRISNKNRKINQAKARMSKLSK